MATSRTGTASHKRFRKQVLSQARADGVTHCPLCRVALDYSAGLKPNSAEPDHIIPVARGGTNDADNGRAICRECNQRRGKGRAMPVAQSRPVVASDIW
jgi:5-methylcytosine-specific restriction endonuclease McrA